MGKPKTIVLAAAEGADATALSELAAPSSTVTDVKGSHDLSDLFSNLVADASADLSVVENSRVSTKKRRKRRKKKDEERSRNIREDGSFVIEYDVPPTVVAGDNVVSSIG